MARNETPITGDTIAQGAFDFTAPAPAAADDNPAPGACTADCPAAPAPRTARTGATRRNGKPRDSQKQKLYDWENDIYPAHQEPVMTDDEIRHLIFRICADHGLPQIPVITDNGHRTSVSVFIGRPRPGETPGERNGKMFMTFEPTGTTYEVAIEIATSEWHRRASIIIHETAHYIANRHYGYGTIAAHGPEYATIIRNLYAHYLGATPARLTRRAARHGVKFAD